MQKHQNQAFSESETLDFLSTLANWSSSSEPTKVLSELYSAMFLHCYPRPFYVNLQ